MRGRREVIFVANLDSYRLGITGFLTSKELRNAGYQANNGLHDQRVALQWIRKFIGGFGGDPSEMTCAGESAGGCTYAEELRRPILTRADSVTMLLTSKEPLAKRILSTGGAVLLFKPLPEAAAEHAYSTVLEAFGLKDKSPEERIQALLTLPIDDLWQKVPSGTPLLPAVDNDIVPGIPNFPIISSQSDDPNFPLPGRKWCPALMIGESKLDVGHHTLFLHAFSSAF